MLGTLAQTLARLLARARAALDRYAAAPPLPPPRPFDTAAAEAPVAERLAAIAPEAPDARTYETWSRELAADGKAGAALVCARRAIALRPRSPWAHFYAAEALALRRQFPEAIAAYREAIARQPESFWFYARLGKTCTDARRWSEAIAAFDSAAYWVNRSDRDALGDRHWDPDGRRRPHFLILGAAKAGTTSLYKYLVQHPQILSAADKEIGFFKQPPRHFGGNRRAGFAWYGAHFPPLAETAPFLTGEATPEYLSFPHVPERVRRSFPDVKLIVLLRDPVDRFVSNYYHWHQVGWDSRSLDRAARQEINRTAAMSAATLHNRRFWQHRNYALRGLYATDLRRWLAFFPREQLLVLESERFYEAPGEVLSETFAFLGVPDCPCDRYPKHNARQYPAAERAVRDRLREFYAPHNRDLADLLGRSFRWVE